MKKLQNILVPVDFTPHSDNALRYAEALAREIPDARLLILHVSHIPAAVTGAGAMALAPYFEDELRSTTKEKFAELETRILQDSPVPYEFMGEWGPAVPDICEVADKSNCDLIILPSHPGSALEEYLGNVTSATIHSAKIPVLVVPPYVNYTMPKTMILATDCQEMPLESSIASLKPWLSQFKPKLRLFHTDPNPQHLPEKKTEALLALKHALRPYGAVLKVTEAADAEEGIIAYARKQHDSMLVVMPRKHNPLYQLLNKSVTHKLAFHTPLPMLVIV